MTRAAHALLVFVAALALACGHAPAVSNNAAAEPDRHADLRRAMGAVEPFFKPMGEPERFDWLATFKEPGQTFDEYVGSNPTLPTPERYTIYVQPLGKFTAVESRVIETTADYLEAFFGLNVKSLPTKSLPARLGEPDQRMIDYPEHRQVRTGWIMETLLTPALPEDAAALIAFTNEDLYPDPSMYFVFGQASLEDRVGVWSLYRLDNGADFRIFLKRTMKIAAHETGHMFSFRHCTKYECVMSGSNHLAETDRRPIDACPECMAKICWMNKEKPRDRYSRLVGFARRYQMKEEAAEFEKKLTAVK